MSPSAITALVAAREIARAVAGGDDVSQVRIVHNVITSLAVPEIVTELGAVPVRTRVGHSFIKAEMASAVAVFGGEHSAHYYFRDFWFADTGMLAALHVLAALGESDAPLSVLGAAYEIRLSLVGSEMCIRDRSCCARLRPECRPCPVSYTHLTLPTSDLV